MRNWCGAGWVRNGDEKLSRERKRDRADPSNEIIANLVFSTHLNCAKCIHRLSTLRRALYEKESERHEEE